jgi:ABC-type uncharacterized transport system substrate-binding protein
MASISLFISHSHLDKSLASAIQSLFEMIFGNEIEVFNSSEDGVQPGNIWRDTLRKNLERANVILVIITPQSLQRGEWVFFEAGASWFASEDGDKILIPCCFPGKLKTPNTLENFQGVNLEDSSDLAKTVTRIERLIYFRPNENTKTLAIKEFKEKLDSLKQSLHANLQRSEASKVVDLYMKTHTLQQSRDFIRLLHTHNLILSHELAAFIETLFVNNP